jgi:predicted phage terminase large subunit-like protein
MTRWHEDDLAGRLLDTQGDRWRVLSLPAQAVDDDPLGRVPGEFLWGDDDYGYGADLQLKYEEAVQAGAMRDWWSLYQQSPRPLDGAIFKVSEVRPITELPDGEPKIVRAWDLAATAQTGTRNPDWTVGLKLAKYPDGRLVVLDVVRMRGGPEEVEAEIIKTATRDGRKVTIGLPQDPGASGKTVVLYLTRRLHGYRVIATPESGSKEERAMPVASQANVGNLSMLTAKWNKAFIDELGGFPNGSKDDQIDSLSRAFSLLIAPPAPARFTRLPFMRR